MRDDRALALELDRALAGEDAGAEARELAALLVAATEPARFEVDEPQIDAALGLARPGAPARRPRLRIAVALAVALAAAVAAFLTVHAPGTDVQARAARALDHVFFVIEDIRPARRGLFAPTTSSGYVDPARGLGRWRVTSGGNLVTETAVDGSRVTRYDAASNTLTIAESCRGSASSVKWSAGRCASRQVGFAAFAFGGSVDWGQWYRRSHRRAVRDHPIAS